MNAHTRRAVRVLSRRYYRKVRQIVMKKGGLEVSLIVCILAFVCYMLTRDSATANNAGPTLPRIVINTPEDYYRHIRQTFSEFENWLKVFLGVNGMLILLLLTARVLQLLWLAQSRIRHRPFAFIPGPRRGHTRNAIEESAVPMESTVEAEDQNAEQ